MPPLLRVVIDLKINVTQVTHFVNMQDGKRWRPESDKAIRLEL